MVSSESVLSEGSTAYILMEQGCKVSQITGECLWMVKWSVHGKSGQFGIEKRNGEVIKESSKFINPFLPGHRQTVQAQIRRRIMWRLIRVYILCLQDFPSNII